jgi:hypothetical protein
LDVIEFGKKIALKEREECIKFVKSLNHLVADALEDKRKYL